MNKVIKYLIYGLVMVVLTSCYSRRATGYLQERSNLPQYEKSEYQEYRLRENDEIVIRIITQNVEMSDMFNAGSRTATANNVLAYRINSDGTVDIPYVSRIPIMGKTIEEAKLIIQDRLKHFVSDVQVKITLNTGTYCVIGDASRGYFPIYKDRLTIFQALALSGDISQSAQFSTVKIIRETPEGTIIKSFDIRTKSILNSEFYYIYPNDIIYLDVSRKRFWGIDSYSGFLSVVSISVTFMLTVWNLIDSTN